MWPFSKNNEKETCDHEEWQTLEDEIAHPNRVYFEDGQPFVHKLTSTRKRCESCGHVAWHENVEEKVYFSVEDREVLKDD